MVFREEVLIGCLRKDVPHVGSDLKHSVSGSGFREFVEVDLQGECVEVLQRDILEVLDEVLPNQQRLHLGSFFLPVRFLSGKKSPTCTVALALISIPTNAPRSSST
jgi:hypothetical protein